MSSFSERLQMLIDLKKTTQQGIVEAVGFNKSQVSRWISGKTGVPRRETLQKLSGFFDCDIEWLATGKSTEQRTEITKNEEIQNTQTVSEPPPRSIQKYEHLTWKFQHIFDFLLEAHDDDAIAINDFMTKLEQNYLIKDPDYRLWMYQRREQAEKRQKKRAAEDNSNEPVDIKSTNGGKS